MNVIAEGKLIIESNKVYREQGCSLDIMELKRYLKVKSIFNKAFKSLYNSGKQSPGCSIAGIDIENEAALYFKIAYGVDWWEPTGFDERPSDTGGFKYGGRRNYMYIVITTNQGSTFHLSEDGYLSLEEKAE